MLHLFVASVKDVTLMLDAYLKYRRALLPWTPATKTISADYIDAGEVLVGD